MQLGQIPYTETEKSSIGQCYAGGIPYNGPYGEALLGRVTFFTLQVYEKVTSRSIWKGKEVYH